MTGPAAHLTAGMSLEQRAALAARTRAHAARLRTIRECPTPLDLAARLDRNTVRTPALELLARRLVDTVRTRSGRLVVSIAPQEGKTTLARALCVWLLAEDPTRRIVYASYAAGLARASGRIVRSHIRNHGDTLGLAVSQDHADAADWQLDGHPGGMVTCGVGGSLTGRPTDVLFVDDPIRNQQDADSATIRDTLHDWWSSVARTRLAPGAPVVVVQTRWHEDDLAGRRIAEGWPLVNIPALADGETPDALARPAGQWLVSARGRTATDWEQTRRDVGERTFAALYQGRPTPLEGGVFKSAWFDTWRVTALPEGCDPPVVVVDPADNEGSGDEAGIILAALHRPTGKVYIVDDLSARMTVARWARTALLTCVRRDAPTLAYEQSLSRLPSRIREAWDELEQQARAILNAGSRDEAVARLSRADDRPAQTDAIAGLLDELTDADVAAILRSGAGPVLTAVQAKGSKDSRMLWAAPLFETGRACMVGHHAKLEYQATTWQVGQSSPDRVDAMTHAVRLLEVPEVDWLLDSPTAPTLADPDGALPRGEAFGRFARPIEQADPWADAATEQRDWTPGAIRTIT